jgi:Cyclic nucleotide-binding domain
MPVMSYTSSATIDNLLPKIEIKQYAEGDVIVKKGMDPHSFFIISIGHAKVESGKFKSKVLEALEFFGEEVAMNQDYKADIIAKGDIVVFKISRDDFEHYLGSIKKKFQEYFLKNVESKFVKGGGGGNISSTKKAMNRSFRADSSDALPNLPPNKKFAATNEGGATCSRGIESTCTLQ